MKLYLHDIRIVGDSPLIVSFAQHYNLAWSSKGLTDTSNTKCAVWEPVLGDNEYMVGHIAFADWQHPASKPHSKLVIIKDGGSDPDAFKEPIGFECVWSARCLPTNLIEDIANNVGKGIVTVGGGIVNTFQTGINAITKLHTELDAGKISNAESEPQTSSLGRMRSFSSTFSSSSGIGCSKQAITSEIPPGSFWRAIAPAGVLFVDFV